MPRIDIPLDDDIQDKAQCIETWCNRELSEKGSFGLIAAEHQDVTDRTATHRWLLRFRGDEKDYITLWLTLRQRTLHFETQFMPAPEHNKEEVLAYLMRKNNDLFGMAFCLGTEDAVYLVGKIPALLIDDDELDRIAGSSVLYVDDHYPTAMTMGHPDIYKRRRKKASS